MDNIIVITQNLKLASLAGLKDELQPGSVLVVSTQYIFENEAAEINTALGRECVFVDFADLLSDAEREKCDVDAFDERCKGTTMYYAVIKELKNRRIVENLLAKYPSQNRLLVCDDLGIDGDVWKENGFKPVTAEYYHVPEVSNTHPRRWGRIGQIVAGQFRNIKHYYKGDIWQTEYDGKKHLFFGSTNRIGYRMDLTFQKASKWENVKFIMEFYLIKIFGAGHLPRGCPLASPRPSQLQYQEDTGWLSAAKLFESLSVLFR